MTILNFPDSPQVGDIFSAEDKSWVWTGTVWDSVGTAASSGGSTNLALSWWLGV